jgi:hypothetical protein
MAEETQQQFDADAFKSSIMEDITKMMNGITKELKKDLVKAITPKAVPTPEPAAQEEPAPTSVSAASPTQNAEINKTNLQVKKLMETVENLTKQLNTTTAEKLEAQRISSIKDAMAGIPFKDETSSKLFFKAITSDIVRDDEGNLVAKTDGGYLPVADYIKNVAETTPGLMAPQGRGGSGATPGKLAKGYSLDDIKPGMPADQQAAIARQALAALGVPQ